MDPLTVSITIAKHRDDVFEYLADVASRSEFTDHYLTDWRLTREDSYGRGAGARYRIKAPFARFGWGDITLVEVDRPHLIVERGRAGKYNRVLTRGVYELQPDGDGGTRLRYTFESKPKFLSDRIQEVLGGRWWLRRKSGRALRRLRTILEEDRGRGRRATISGGARKPASAFRFSGPPSRHLTR